MCDNGLAVNARRIASECDIDLGGLGLHDVAAEFGKVYAKGLL